MRCYRHRNVSVSVSCGRCGRPICPDCMVSSAAGMRCPECASHPRAVTGAPDTTDRIGIAVSVALFLSIIGAMFLKALGVFAMAVGPLTGALVAEVVLRILGTRQKPAYLHALSLGCIAFGSALALSKVLPGLGFTVMNLPSTMTDMVVGFSLGLSLSACYGRMRAALEQNA